MGWVLGFFFPSLAIGTTLTRLKGSCVRVHLGRWGKLTVRHLIFISRGSTHFNTYHSLFRWIQQQRECVLLLGFLGDHSMQWCLLFSQGKAVAFATKSVALFTATESSFRGGGWSSSFTAYTWEKSNATTARQVLSKGKNPNKSCLHWQWQDLPAYMAFSSYSCTARSPLACLQKTRSLSIYSKYRLSQLTFRTKKNKNIQNSLQHTITVKNYIHTVLPKKVPEDKYTYQQGAQTPQSSHKYSAC